MEHEFENRPLKTIHVRYTKNVKYSAIINENKKLENCKSEKQNTIIVSYIIYVIYEETLILFSKMFEIFLPDLDMHFPGQNLMIIFSSY